MIRVSVATQPGANHNLPPLQTFFCKHLFIARGLGSNAPRRCTQSQLKLCTMTTLGTASALLLRAGRSILFGCKGAPLASSNRLVHTSGSSEQWAPQASGYLGTGAAGDEHDGEPRFLVTGACGQIGSELIPFLRSRVGVENVVASDVKTSRQLLETGPFVYLDVSDKDNMARIAIEYGVTHIIHLATLLSAVGERNPQLALKINTTGIQNVLDLAAQHRFSVFSPSTIAVFGTTSPKVNTPNDTVMQPNTMYGITKVHTELLGQYYHDKFGVDFRSLRYPGIISAKAPPGGGTTDYAVDIFHQALRRNAYTCFLSEKAELPMMYMPDCLEATWQLIKADKTKLSRTTYNVTAMSFSPQQLAAEIKQLRPEFKITYTPDYRDAIAHTWPMSIDDGLARQDWGWNPKYDLPGMTQDMLTQLQKQIEMEQQRQVLRARAASNVARATTAAAAAAAAVAAAANKAAKEQAAATQVAMPATLHQ